MTGVDRRIKLRMFDEADWTCERCGLRDDVDPKDGGTMTVDHIRPKKYGGPNAMDNLRVLCRSCNNKRGRSGPKRQWFDALDDLREGLA